MDSPTFVGGVPQFAGTGAPRVLVRNTFLDFEDAPVTAPILAKAASAPPRPSADLPDSDEESGNRDGEEGDAPPPIDLTRIRTEDQWEDPAKWDWAANDPSEASSSTAPPPPPPPPVQPGGPAMMPMMPIAGQSQMRSMMPGPGVPVVRPMMPGSGMPVMPGAGMYIGSGGMPMMPGVMPMMPVGRSAPATGVSLGAGGGEAAPIAVSHAPDLSVPQPQQLQRAMSINSHVYRVNWTVDGRKLRGNDKQAVSPPFDLSLGTHGSVTFKMMLYPKTVADGRGGASFKKAKGCGYVQLKCEAELTEALAQVNFRLGIGSGDTIQESRGPVCHNFAQSAVAGLPRDQEEWDFMQVLDENSQTFVVTLEIVPRAG